ncbi:hypothetical protein O0I10_011718 [Lichtheimia ornata]|uniref:Uncharacterized protein n=1 Tax=Lichtheimia ornata TaxID=688661 RepID=A0AAD7XSE1_9FUNG|nr:uncharacterized protein O0I10_011718 [Lichtheimia ornata]KAJ8652640.1 hypothetical protein O0I10_011718 [Lichtheimia ornata]
MDKKAELPPPPVIAWQHTNETHKRWTWVRRFIAVLVVLAVVMHCTAPRARLSQLWKHTYSNDKEPQLVLHTGFPVPDAVVGQTIQPKGYSAAMAFAPVDTSSSSLTVQNKESWWDRIFSWRHVHLASVQLAVTSPGPLDHVRATISICTSTHDDLWQSIPDATKCIASTMRGVDEGTAPDEPLGIITWNPVQEEKDAIVLKKNKVYWLVVEAPPGADAFEWALAQISGGVGAHQGVALETPERGWQLQNADDDDAPIPSVMLSVVPH